MMDQILKIYEPIFHLLEYQYQARSETVSFNEYVLNQLLAGKKLVDENTNDTIVSELYESSKTDDLYDVEIEYAESFVNTNVNLALTFTLKAYDHHIMDVRPRYEFFRKKSDKHELFNLVTAVSDANQRLLVHEYYKKYLLTSFAVILSFLVMTGIDTTCLDGVTKFSIIFDTLITTLAPMVLIFIVPTIYSRAFKKFFGLSALLTLSLSLINQLGLLSQTQRFILNQDLLVFVKFGTLSYSLILLFWLFSRLFDRSENDALTLAGDVKSIHNTAVTIYRYQKPVAYVENLKLSLKNEKNFEDKTLKSL